jgi:hypothetical protein
MTSMTSNMKSIKKNKVFVPIPLRRNDLLTAFLVVTAISFAVAGLLVDSSIKEYTLANENFERAIKQYEKAEKFYLELKAHTFYLDCMKGPDGKKLGAICSNEQFLSRFLFKCSEANFRDLVNFFSPTQPSTQV